MPTPAKDPVGAERGDRQLWAMENHADRRSVKAPPATGYDCAELLAFLAANPERESRLLRQFMDTQLKAGGCK